MNLQVLRDYVDEIEAAPLGALMDKASPDVRAALKRTQGHRQEAAKLLGWGRNTLTRKLKELGMDASE